MKLKPLIVLAKLLMLSCKESKPILKVSSANSNISVRLDLNNKGALWYQVLYSDLSV